MPRNFCMQPCYATYAMSTMTCKGCTASGARYDCVAKLLRVCPPLQTHLHWQIICQLQQCTIIHKLQHNNQQAHKKPSDSLGNHYSYVIFRIYLPSIFLDYREQLFYLKVIFYDTRSLVKKRTLISFIVKNVFI